jgi:hypothetical protein
LPPETVFHIRKGSVEPARMTDAAERQADGTLIYPSEAPA